MATSTLAPSIAAPEVARPIVMSPTGAALPDACPLCLGTLREPLILGCETDHVVCGACAELLVALAFTSCSDPLALAPATASEGAGAAAAGGAAATPSSGSGSGRLSAGCITCHKVHDLHAVSKTSVPTFRTVMASLPLNDTIRRDAALKEAGRQPTFCEGPRLEACMNVPTRKCKECDAIFCDDCDIAMHAHAKRTAHERSALEGAPVESAGYCRVADHGHAPLDYYDHTDNKLLCDKCLWHAEKELGHRVERQVDRIARLQKELQGDMDTMTRRAHITSFALKAVRDTTAALESNYAAAEKRIAEVHASLRDAVEAAVSEAKAEAGRVYHLRLATLQKQAELLTRMSDNYARIAGASELARASRVSIAHRNQITRANAVAHESVARTTLEGLDLKPGAESTLALDTGKVEGVLAAIRDVLPLVTRATTQQQAKAAAAAAAGGAAAAETA